MGLCHCDSEKTINSPARLGGRQARGTLDIFSYNSMSASSYRYLRHLIEICQKIATKACQAPPKRQESANGRGKSVNHNELRGPLVFSNRPCACARSYGRKNGEKCDISSKS